MHRLITLALVLVALANASLACASTDRDVDGAGAGAGGPAAAASPATSPSPSAAIASDEPSGARHRARRTALFFGDSYFVGGGCSPDPKQGMAYLAGTELGYATVVRGAGGTGFVSALPEYDLLPYLQQIEQGALDVEDPSLVVIEGGSNDIGSPLPQIKRHARTVLEIVAAKYPSALIVLAGPMQTSGSYAGSRPIARGLRKVARSMDLPFMNLLTWTQGHLDWICDDFVHPNYYGHQQLAEQMADALTRRGA